MLGVRLSQRRARQSTLCFATWSARSSRGPGSTCCIVSRVRSLTRMLIKRATQRSRAPRVIADAARRPIVSFLRGREKIHAARTEFPSDSQWLRSGLPGRAPLVTAREPRRRGPNGLAIKIPTASQSDGDDVYSYRVRESCCCYCYHPVPRLSRAVCCSSGGETMTRPA